MTNFVEVKYAQTGRSSNTDALGMREMQDLVYAQRHHRLDLAVERIYRPEPFASDEERLEHLFRLYAKMTKK